MRKLATIRTIKSIENIEGASRIQLAKVDGWQSIIQIDSHKPGDKIVFVEIDSILPKTEWSAFLQDKNKPEKHIRVKTIKMRGIVSQGVIFPLTILPEGYDNLEEGNDVSDVLNITKYEPPELTQLSGEPMGNFPTHLFPKTDSPRIQNFISKDKFLEEMDGRRFVCRVKEDGSSFSAYWYNGIHGVCSRNLQLKLDNANNAFVRAFYENGINHLFERLKKNIAIQAELIGPGIQKNRSNVPRKTIRVFDIYDIDNKCYLSFDDLWHFCSINYLPQVTTIDDNFIFNKNETSIDTLISMTENLKYDNTENSIEGLVFTSFDEYFSSSMQDRCRFKIINPIYCLENDG